VPKTALDRRVIQAYRSAVRPPGDNRALAACRAFRGDVLVVESAEDEVIPRPTIQSFLQAFEQPRSLVHHVLAGADHELSRPVSQEVYEALLLSWIDSVSRRT